MIKNEIEMTVDGASVRGSVRRTSFELDVLITHPFAGLTAGSHIPYFMRAARDFDGSHGDESALALLTELHRLGGFLSEHISELQSAYDRLSREDSSRTQTVRLGFFEEDKAILRRSLRSGKIDSATYQKKLALLREDNEKRLSQSRATKDAFFEKHFPMMVSSSTQEDVLKILNQPELLLPQGCGKKF